MLLYYQLRVSVMKALYPEWFCFSFKALFCNESKPRSTGRPRGNAIMCHRYLPEIVSYYDLFHRARFVEEIKTSSLGNVVGK